MDKKRLIAIFTIIMTFIVLIILSLLYYNGKYMVYFETGTEEAILTKYVNKNDKVKEPIEPTKDGYVFKEWQLDGKTYDFDTRIKNDTVLTAKWIKEEYITISFDTGTDNFIENKKILKGTNLNQLPDSYKDGYEFKGWAFNNKIYNGEVFNDDVVLEAVYETIKPKIGDIVLIIGNYSNSAYSLNAYNKKAIGWKREILNIIENSEFPYVVGNKTGVTGYFKESGLERIVGYEK